MTQAPMRFTGNVSAAILADLQRLGSDFEDEASMHEAARVLALDALAELGLTASDWLRLLALARAMVIIPPLATVEGWEAVRR